MSAKRCSFGGCGGGVGRVCVCVCVLLRKCGCCHASIESAQGQSGGRGGLCRAESAAQLPRCAQDKSQTRRPRVGVFVLPSPRASLVTGGRGARARTARTLGKEIAEKRLTCWTVAHREPFSPIRLCCWLARWLAQGSLLLAAVLSFLGRRARCGAHDGATREKKRSCAGESVEQLTGALLLVSRSLLLSSAEALARPERPLSMEEVSVIARAGGATLTKPLHILYCHPFSTQCLRLQPVVL